MHETILKTVTVGIVAGLAVYWLTSRHSADGDKNTNPGDYKPIFGDVRSIRFGSGTCACCQCCGLPAPQNSSVPLAADYLCCYPEYAPTVSKWNLGVSLQLSCEGIDLHSCITREETATSFPYDVSGPNTVTKPIKIAGKISCQPNVPVSVECTEVI